MQNIIIISGCVFFGALLIWPPLAGSRIWRAAITPLASIIGSGFLIIGPILNTGFGAAAPLVMLGLCALAYLYGSAIRFNIARNATVVPPSGFIRKLDAFSSVVLVMAYIISVTYYLNLFGAFGLSLTPLDNENHFRMLSSASFIFILIIGWTRGFAALEHVEQISVGIKLTIICSMLVGLAWYFAQRATQENLPINPPQFAGWHSLAMIAGLIVTVQGFETSRYLGATYDAPLRIASMRLAQWISTAIYIIYILLLTFSFPANSFPLSETAIIDMMQGVAPVLPILLVIAALSAQLSAAVADTSGSGGLVQELTKGRISEKTAYLILTLTGLFLTWSANIFEIISYTSRAFALYYALQSAIAAFHARQSGHSVKAALYALLAFSGILIMIFARPIE